MVYLVIMLKTITVWFRLNHETDDFEHNHIENDHVFGSEPVPLNDYQRKAWKGCKWQYEHRFITEDYILVF
jgi:hypothetical protein